MDPAGRLNPNRRGGPGPAPAPASSPTQPPFDLELLRKASATLTPQAFLSLLETDVYPQLAALHKSISSGLAAKFEEAIKLQEGRDVYLKNVNYVGHKASLDDQVEELVVAVRRNWKEGWEHHDQQMRDMANEMRVWLGQLFDSTIDGIKGARSRINFDELYILGDDPKPFRIRYSAREVVYTGYELRRILLSFWRDLCLTSLLEDGSENNRLVLAIILFLEQQKLTEEFISLIRTNEEIAKALQPKRVHEWRFVHYNDE